MRKQIGYCILPLVLAITFQMTPINAVDKLNFPCQGGGSYSVILPAGAAVDGKNCAGALVLNETVRIIDDSAFESSKLTSVVIPNSVQSIGVRVFAFSTLILASDCSQVSSCSSSKSGRSLNSFFSCSPSRGAVRRTEGCF